MNKILLISLLFFSFSSFSQNLYTLKLIDSIPMHFNFATNEINNLENIQPRIEKLQAIKEGKVVINAYTDSVGTIEYNTELAEKRMQTTLEFIQENTHQNIFIFSNNKNESRENQPLSIEDSLFRRSDILIFENQLDIEYDKPYPLPINFDGNQHFLRPEAKLVIDKMIAVLEQHPDLKIKLHGHVSGHSGDYELSLNRTLSVKKYMVERGINENRITCKGFDNKKKLYHEQPWENNPLNRRVEILFLE